MLSQDPAWTSRDQHGAPGTSMLCWLLLRQVQVVDSSSPAMVCGAGGQGHGGLFAYTEPPPGGNVLASPEVPRAGVVGAGGHAPLCRTRVRHLFFRGPFMSPLPPHSSDPIPGEDAGYWSAEGSSEVTLGEPGRGAAVCPAGCLLAESGTHP